jgi:hypothetical protein
VHGYIFFECLCVHGLVGLHCAFLCMDIYFLKCLLVHGYIFFGMSSCARISWAALVICGYG